jgi:hypothetical protein
LRNNINKVECPQTKRRHLPTNGNLNLFKTV